MFPRVQREANTMLGIRALSYNNRPQPQPAPMPPPNPAPPPRWYRILYVQVLIAVALGIVIGHFFPDTGKALKPLGDGFIKLVKMMIAPIIFCTVVHGIASMTDLKRLGQALRAL